MEVYLDSAPDGEHQDAVDEDHQDPDEQQDAAGRVELLQPGGLGRAPERRYGSVTAFAGDLSGCRIGVTGCGPIGLFAVAVAKSRIGEAAGRGAEIAHQVHGAMGFTREHNLHYSTRRLWSWRDEFGNESYWQTRLGRAVAASGADALWPMLSRL